VNTIFGILLLLQIKHFLIDFVFQTEQEILHKGTYLHPIGFMHSVKHCIGTLIVFSIFSCSMAGPLAVLDCLIHYNIDWMKMNYGCKNLKLKEFWVHFGLDQFAHQLTYLFIAYLSYCIH